MFVTKVKFGLIQGSVIVGKHFFRLSSLDRLLGFLWNDSQGLLFSLKVFILEGHVILFHFLLIVRLGFIRFNTVEFVDFFKGLQGFGDSSIGKFIFFSMFFNDLFVLENFLLKIEIFAQMITLLFVGLLLIIFSDFYGLIIHYMLHFLLNFIGKLIP